ncbi:MAG: NUDIX domain-containing protein [Candidatus Staskawiczbacteria bacterium]|nr:NUDIX domain-containing protein [Candidatus Staskawiczbacteria bacterium]
MSKERNKSVPAVYLILRKDNKILLGRRKDTGYYDGWYGVPAGHVDAKELPIVAGIREAKEEVGVDINSADIQFAHALYRTAHDETGDRSDYFFMVQKWDGEPRIMESEKCDDLQWFPITNLPENTIHHEKGAIENIVKGIHYSEIDKEQTHQSPSS